MRSPNIPSEAETRRHAEQVVSYWAQQGATINYTLTYTPTGWLLEWQGIENGLPTIWATTDAREHYLQQQSEWMGSRRYKAVDKPVDALGKKLAVITKKASTRSLPHSVPLSHQGQYLRKAINIKKI